MLGTTFTGGQITACFQVDSSHRSNAHWMVHHTFQCSLEGSRAQFGRALKAVATLSSSQRIQWPKAPTVVWRQACSAAKQHIVSWFHDSRKECKSMLVKGPRRIDLTSSAAGPRIAGRWARRLAQVAHAWAGETAVGYCAIYFRHRAERKDGSAYREQHAKPRQSVRSNTTGKKCQRI